MTKIVLENTVSGYNLQVINNNFDEIANTLNNKVLYRDNPLGDPNQMNQDLDMNGNKIFNLGEPTTPSGAARLQDVQNAIAGANQANLIEFTPAGSVSSTNVQAAIEEIDSDLQSIISSGVNVTVVKNITNLKALDKTKFYRAETQGYYEEGDSGGASYWLDSNDTTSADNGGTIIVATDGGRWKLVKPLSANINQFGAVGDGVADDRQAIVNALTQIGVARLVKDKKYKFRSRIDMPDESSIIGAPNAELIMDSSAGGFDSVTSYTGAANQIGIYMNAMTKGGIDGVTIKMNTLSDDLIASAFVIRASSDVFIRNCDISNFAKSKVIRIETGNRVVIERNYIHDVTTNSATNGQVTAIDVDDNRAGFGSTGVIIRNNIIRNITVGASFLALYGYQTDAINVSYEDSSSHLIQDNYIQNVGEGVDCFGADCIITGNNITGAYLFGVKLIHGARRNIVSNNKIFRPGLAGIVLAGSNLAANNVEFNQIIDNSIFQVNGDGNFNASGTAGIKTEDTGASKVARFNTIRNNCIILGTAMKKGLLSADNSTKNEWIDNYVDSFTEDEFSKSINSTDNFVSAKKSYVHAYMSVAQSASSGANVQYDAELEDTNSEYNSGTYRYTASAPRRVSVIAALRTGAATAGQEYGLIIHKNGVPVGRSSVVASGSTMGIIANQVIKLNTGDFITIAVVHTAGAPITFTNSSEQSYLQIQEI